MYIRIRNILMISLCNEERWEGWNLHFIDLTYQNATYTVK